MDCATCRQDLASLFKCLVCGAELCSPCMREHRKSRCWPAPDRGRRAPSTSRSMSAEIPAQAQLGRLKTPAGPAITGTISGG